MNNNQEQMPKELNLYVGNISCLDREDREVFTIKDLVKNFTSNEIAKLLEKEVKRFSKLVDHTTKEVVKQLVASEDSASRSMSINEKHVNEIGVCMNNIHFLPNIIFSCSKSSIDIIRMGLDQIKLSEDIRNLNKIINKSDEANPDPEDASDCIN